MIDINDLIQQAAVVTQFEWATFGAVMVIYFSIRTISNKLSSDLLNNAKRVRFAQLPAVLSDLGQANRRQEKLDHPAE